jgi:hypothetical protein
MQGERQIQIVDRENNLRARYKEIEDALATPTEDGYDVALDNLKTLITMREDILRSASATSTTPPSNRVDLSPTTSPAKGWSAVHEAPPSSSPTVPSAASCRAVGVPAYGEPRDRKTDTSLLGLNRRNNLIRWQNGDIEADPLVVFEAWQNAQAFSFVDQIKKLMWDIGTPIDPLHPIPANIYIINRKGIPIPSLIPKKERCPARIPTSRSAASSRPRRRDGKTLERLGASSWTPRAPRS